MELLEQIKENAKKQCKTIVLPEGTVSFEARSGAVALDKDSKHYVQGIRISGRDNKIGRAHV